ncbi:deoxynucleotidyltransferase terminal-interacting protein 2 [Erinaceus europaeus]|uniref:Deoxynucleotidyltransferase terminal-interacting protein 2 n=1 Tax=Erinaceus europaeus TaxID=9365 RepID=A0A1S3AI45_ERIEU|nr:deoxynucleotidyltransferase terminal-interacting protein 2 [Erinaceus europaeus]
MVVTRSSGPPAKIQDPSAEGSRQKNSATKRSQVCPNDGEKLQSDDQNATEPQTQTTKKQRPPSKTAKKNRTTDSLLEKTKPPTDGESSEAESESSSVSELQDTILRVTRRRQIVVACTPVSSVRKRVKKMSISESNTEEIVSEAGSHCSGISRIVTPTVITTRTRSAKARSLIVPNQESHEEAISDVESSCSDISSFSGIVTRRTMRSMPGKLQAQIREKDAKVVLGYERQIEATPPVNTEALDARKKLTVLKCQHFDREEKTNDASVKEMKNSKTSGDETKEIINEGEEIIEKSNQLSLSSPQDTRLYQVASQKHSTPQNKTTLESSNSGCGAIMKSLSQTFAVVKVNRCDRIKGSTKTSDFKEFSDGSDEEYTVMGVDINEEKDTGFECANRLYNSELNTSQDKGDSVLLVLSSDESQQSENSENEEDTVCFIENCRKESLKGENKLGDNALFVIDTTPGLSADKNFYLDEEDKANEIAIEEGKEEEGESGEESASSDKHRDSELSDEDDMLNSTKSKLLKLTSSSIDPGLSIKQLGGLYINFSTDKLQSNKRTLTQIKEKKKNEFLQKAIITPDFEKNYCVPPYRESKYQLQKKRRKERQKTAGDGWFGMKAPELSDELKNDLKALKMRASMDPKRFYKKNDRDGFPKYFQVGTIVDNPADFYHSRIPKKERKRNIVEELLADSEFRRYNRRKYAEIMAEKAANAAGKKFRKKKKFRN